MKAYQQGETVVEEAELYNENNLPINPDTIIITIRDIELTDKITELPMLLKEYGKFYYNYPLTNDALIGLWKVIVKATLDGVDTIKNDSFRVVP